MPVTVAEVAPLGRRDRKKQQTRAALVEAALRLVAERGLDHVTVDDISDAADVSSRTFFNYFSTKDEAVIDGQVIDSEAIRLRFVAVPAGVPTLAAMRLALVETIAAMEAERELWLLRMRVIAATPVLLSRLLVGGAAAERYLADTVAARVGVDPHHPYPLLVTVVTGAAFRAAMLRWAGNDGQSLAAHVDEAFAQLATGLADPRPTPPRRPPAAVRSSTKDN